VCIFALFLSALSLACSVAEPETRAETPSRRDLIRRYRQEGRVLVVYGASVGGTVSEYETFGKQIASYRPSWKVEVKSDAETKRDDFRRTAVYLVGTARSNRWFGKLAEALPLSIDEAGFSFYEESYRDSTDVLRMLFPNPVDPEYPIFVIMGNSDEYLAQHLDTSRRRGDFEVTRNGMTLVMGSFAQSRSGDWMIDPQAYRVFESSEEATRSTAHFDYFVHGTLDEVSLESLSRANEAIYAQVVETLGNEAELPKRKLQVHVYGNSEGKGLVTNDTSPAHYDEKTGVLHVTLEAEKVGAREAKTAEFVLRLVLGKPKKLFLERGLAVYLADRALEKRDYLLWAARLTEAGEILPLEQLLDDERMERESDYVVDPLAGTFARLLLSQKADFLSLYSNWNLTSTELAGLEADWRDSLVLSAQTHRAEIESRHDRFPPPPDRYQKGFTHAHEGYQIYNGYLSERSDEALRKLGSFGADAVAIVPYTFMRNPNEPVHLPVPSGSGSENDESVIHSVRTAQNLGMTVMLKPQIWLHGGWPGDIRMKSKEDVRAFFEHYYRWIRHYALMAEHLEVPVLCIGTELRQMTVGNEVAWIEMIGRLRKLYSGRLVYAANWHGELDRLTFWRHLDYIGVNSYYPLSGKSNPRDEELKEGFRHAIDQIRVVYDRFRKPVLLTEIGFTSTPEPWREPHEPGRRKPVNLHDQARSYEIAFEGLSKETDWIRGVYWWKWPSDLGHGGSDHPGFTPNGKPAEEVVRKWYGNDR
jgi:hypothetical protein